jgi:hypothetical protein
MNVEHAGRCILMAVVAVLLACGVDDAHANPVVVSPEDMAGWAFLTTSGDGSAEFVDGPENPPMGTGSVRLATGTHGHLSAQIRNAHFQGIGLGELTALSYWTYGISWDGQRLPYLVLNVDLNGDGVFDLDEDDLLFFEPIFQTATTGNPALPSQAPVALATWQSWDALAGGWWSLHGIAEATPGPGVKPLHHYLAAEPNATIINARTGAGGVRVVVGFGEEHDVFDGNVDAVTIGVNGAQVTYNFLLGAAPMPVELDIVPGEYPNVVELQSPHVLPVAILSTTDFDARSDVVVSSLTFGRSGHEASLVFCDPRGSDVDDDGLLDQVCYFRIEATGFLCNDTEGVLRGRLIDGKPLMGMDAVLVTPCS